MWKFPTGIPAEFLSDCEANESSYENICRNCRKLTAKIAAHYVCKAQTLGNKLIQTVSMQNTNELCKNRLCADCLLDVKSKLCFYKGCEFRFSSKSKLLIYTNDLMSLVFKCPEKLCTQKLHYEDFLVHTVCSILIQYRRTTQTLSSNRSRLSMLKRYSETSWQKSELVPP